MRLKRKNPLFSKKIQPWHSAWFKRLKDRTRLHCR